MRTLNFAVLTFIYIPLCLYSQTMIIHTTDGQSQSILINQIESITFSASQAPTVGLVAYYPFNGNANDVSGNGHHGIVHGVALTKNRFGKSESAYSFDGIDDFIELPRTPGILNRVQTLSFWVYFYKDIDTTSYTPEEDFIIGKAHDTGFYRDVYSRYWKNKVAHASSSHQLHTNTVFIKNRWYNLTFVRTFNSHTVYVNGVYDNSINYTDYQIDENDYFYIGKYYNTRSDRLMDGIIDDIRIYNRALSPEEIQLIYQDQN